MISDVMVWAQMFFDDGSVSQGVRVSVDVFTSRELINITAQNILNQLHRTEGFMLLWGAGDMMGISISSSAEASMTSASEILIPLNFLCMRLRSPVSSQA